jgi:hypothetical protein
MRPLVEILVSLKKEKIKKKENDWWNDSSGRVPAYQV